MIHLYDIIDLCKLKAIVTKFQNDQEYVWRQIERDYSTTFSTPLHEVKFLDPEYVLVNLYEHQLKDLDIDDEKELQLLLDNLYTIEDPAYDKTRDAEEEEYNRKAVEEEELKKAKATAKKHLPKKEEPPKELPKSGGINLSYLADSQEQEG